MSETPNQSDYNIQEVNLEIARTDAAIQARQQSGETVDEVTLSFDAYQAMSEALKNRKTRPNGWTACWPKGINK